MSSWMDSSCLIVGESNRKGGVADLELPCPDLLFGETPHPAEYRRCLQQISSRVSRAELSCLSAMGSTMKEAVLVFSGRSERAILPLPASPQLLPSPHSP